MIQSADPGPDFFPRRLLIALGMAIAAYFAIGELPLADTPNPQAARLAAATTALVAGCWLSGALPLGAASLLPLAVMPPLGVLSVEAAATSYARPIVWLFFGGFVLALGIERWGLHKRLALGVIVRLGVDPPRLVLGFMVASAGLSMWMLNTSVTLMLLPIAMALVQSMVNSGAVDAKGEENFAFTLLVGIAYASSIGGTGTPIGTAPNGIFLSHYAMFEDQGAPPMTFIHWMAIGLPLVLIFVPGVWWLLVRFLAPVPGANPQARKVLETEAQALPPMSTAEKRVLGLFLLAAALWATRRDLALGEWFTVPGWWRLLPIPDARYLGDGAVAVFVALLSFILPSGRKPGEAIMNWATARTLPWDIILLMGGGIAIAEAFKTTGLARAVGLSLQPLIGDLPPLLMVAVTCAVVTFLTEFTSNVAMTSLLLPVLAAASDALQIDPRLLMVPATLSASCAFMLPIATPPNAIVFSSGRIPMIRMAKTGLWFNLLGVMVVTTVVWWVAKPQLGMQIDEAPTWSQLQSPAPNRKDRGPSTKTLAP